MNALGKAVIDYSVDDFYSLSRAVLIKDESQFDKFDKAFADYFEGVQAIDLFDKEIPEDWRKEHSLLRENLGAFHVTLIWLCSHLFNML